MRVAMNEAARRVMELAAEESRTLGHGYVGTEHVLLGIVREGGVAARELAGRGAAVEKGGAGVGPVGGGWGDGRGRVGGVGRAMAEAAGRFGDVRGWAGELAGSVPRAERWEYVVERQLGWRAPESVLRYVARVTGQLAIF